MTHTHFAIVIADPSCAAARSTALSLKQQIYRHWSVYLTSEDEDLFHSFKQLIGADRLFRVTSLDLSVPAKNGHFVLPLLPGDDLLPDALATMALEIEGHAQPVRLVYTDHFEQFGSTNYLPFFKPAWSPEFLLATDYVGRAALDATIFNAAHLPVAFDAVDLWRLWLTQRSVDSKFIAHVERPVIKLAAAETQTPEMRDRAGKMLEEQFFRMGIRAEARQSDWARRLDVPVFDFGFEDFGPKVSILIPSRNNWAVLKRCVDSLSGTLYSNFEAIVIDNESDDPATIQYISELKLNPPDRVRVVSIASPASGFSYSYINNEAVGYVDGEYLLFLNDDTEVIAPEWLSQMVGWARIPGVASVGARLYFPDDLVQHNGLVNQLLDGVLPAPAFKLMRRRSIGVRGQAVTARNYSAVTAACMLTPRSLFLDVGGFDDEDFSVAYNDCDYGFKLTGRGLRHVCVPTAELYHYEGSSRGRGRGNDKIAEEIACIRRYGGWSDPYFNANFAKDSFLFTPATRVVIGESLHQPRCCVGLITHNLNFEGAPLVLLDIARGLVAEMSQVVIFSLVDGPLRESFEAAGCTVVIRRDVGVFGTHSEAELARVVMPIADEFAVRGVDVVLANTIVSHWGLKAAETAGLPSIWVIHESEAPFHHLAEHGAHHATAGLESFRRSYLNVFVCAATRQLYAPLAQRNNLEVVYNGFDRAAADREMAGYDRATERASLNVADDELLFLLPGTVCERKSQKDLVHAIATLPTNIISECRFLIVGDRDGEYSREMHRLIADLPERLQSRIQVIGERSDIWRYYVAADALTFTSRLESFPRVIQEAMHRGLAIISTPVFGISEQLRDGQTGLFFEPGDIGGLVKEISRVVGEPALRQRLGEMAKMALDRFPTMASMQRTYVELVREAYMTGTQPSQLGSGLSWLDDGGLQGDDLLHRFSESLR